MSNDKFDFETFKDFFKSWGLYPHNENTDGFNPEVIRQGINEPCFNQMLHQAEMMYGPKFRSLCSNVVDAMDNSFYLEAVSWHRLELELDALQSK